MNAFAIIASVVSMPPNRSTAAFEATCARVSPPVRGSGGHER